MYTLTHDKSRSVHPFLQEQIIYRNPNPPPTTGGFVGYPQGPSLSQLCGPRSSLARLHYPSKGVVSTSDSETDKMDWEDDALLVSAEKVVTMTLNIYSILNLHFHIRALMDPNLLLPTRNYLNHHLISQMTRMVRRIS